MGWDQSLLDAGPQGWQDGEHVIKVEDGYVHDIFVLSILTRKRYEHYGYLFYPKYLSMFNDTEFGEVARRDGVVIEAHHLLFEHMHPDCHKRSRDAVDLVHASQERWQAGEMLFNLRRSLNFPLDDGPKAVKSIAPPKTVTNNRFVAYLQVTKDDLCLYDVCARLMEEGVTDFCFAQPSKYWSGEEIGQESYDEISAVILKLIGKNVTTHHRIFDVDKYQMPGDSRIVVETRVRNDSLEWIRSLGYQHILIVDVDELWIRGTLGILKDYVDQGHKVLSVYMVPVIGVPGYPVEYSQDLAVVYVGEGITFKACRSPFVQQTIVHRQLIYHFTGTRKGMEETIVKHRRSGHYDDAEYDFETWINDVLPNIKPGYAHKWKNGNVGVHMYVPRQIWNAVRAWRPGELESMPESVRPYLGV